MTATTTTTGVLTCGLTMSADNAAGRVYTDDLPGLDSFECPSVTTICDYLNDGGRGLQIWWADAALRAAAGDLESTDDIDTWVKKHKTAGFAALARAADRGTAVHQAAERMLLGQPHGLSPVWDPDAYPYAAALEAFFADHRPEPVAVECPVFNRTEGYAGRGDVLWYLKSMPGRLLVGDWKTRSSADQCATARTSEPVQVSAYARGEYMIVDGLDGPERHPVPKVDGAVVVALGPDGTYNVLEVPIDDEVFAVFRGLLRDVAPYILGRPDKTGVPVPAVGLTEQLEASLAAAGLTLADRPGDAPGSGAGHERLDPAVRPAPGAPSPQGYGAPEPPLVTIDTAVLDWLRGRARWLHQENPQAFERLVATWPPGVPGLHGDTLPTLAELDAVAALFDSVEAAHTVPFYDQPDPRAEAVRGPRVVVDALPPRTTPLGAPIVTPPLPDDPGDDAPDDQLVTWIAAHFKALPTALALEIERAAAQAGIARIREGATRDQLDMVASFIKTAEAETRPNQAQPERTQPT